MKPFLRSLQVLGLWMCLGLAPAWADGTLTHMSGPVSVTRANGQTEVGRAGLTVQTGDTLVTGATGFVRMEMSDGGELVLRPNSELKIENYRYVQSSPADDRFVFSMVKGGLRTITGLIGKRGNRDAYELKTTVATIGIRGTQFDLRECQANCGSLPPGTYLAVRFGAVQASNALGSLPVAAGQVAHVPVQRPPVMLPRDPGIGFTPPAVIPRLDERRRQQTTPPTSTAPTPQTQPASGGSTTSSSTTQSTQRNSQASTSTTGTSSTGSGASSSSPGTNTGSGAGTESTNTGSRPAETGNAALLTNTSTATPTGATSGSPAAPAAMPLSGPAPGSSNGPECVVQ